MGLKMQDALDAITFADHLNATIKAPLVADDAKIVVALLRDANSKLIHVVEEAVGMSICTLRKLPAERAELATCLVESSIKDLDGNDGEHELLLGLLTNGFKGYSHMTLEELVARADAELELGWQTYFPCIRQLVER